MAARSVVVEAVAACSERAAVEVLPLAVVVNVAEVPAHSDKVLLQAMDALSRAEAVLLALGGRLTGARSSLAAEARLAAAEVAGAGSGQALVVVVAVVALHFPEAISKVEEEAVPLLVEG